jgi:hypothetical protein
MVGCTVVFESHNFVSVCRQLVLPGYQLVSACSQVPFQFLAGAQLI